VLQLADVAEPGAAKEAPETSVAQGGLLQVQAEKRAEEPPEVGERDASFVAVEQLSHARAHLVQGGHGKAKPALGVLQG